MTDQDTFDVVVIGAGAVGEVLAGRTAASGLKTAIIESELAGGECSYWACMPSKALLKPLNVLDSARRVPGAKSAITGSLDVNAVLESRNSAAANWDDAGQVKWIEDSNITFIRGFGRLDGERRVVVSTPNGDRGITATKAVVVATGSVPAKPPIKGIDDVDAWYSRDATSAKAVPKSLAVIGGGTVACEMAQAWSSLGAQVTLLVRGDRLIDREEPFASDALVKSFKDNGIDVRFGVSVVSAVKTSEASIQLALGDGTVMATEKVLVATGRKPHSVGIGVETIGLEPGKAIAVDKELRATGVEGDWLYAIGDVNGLAAFTHMGKYQARMASDVIAGKNVQDWADHHAVPGVIFTEPQVASVGLRLADAKKQNLNVREVRVPWTSVAAASLNGIKEPESVAQLVVDEDRHVVVGASFVGPEAGELIHAATIAIAGEVPLDKLWHAVPSYPTLSELWLRLLEAYGL